MVPVLTRFLLSPEYICNKLLKSCNEIDYQVLNATDFVQRVLKEKPDFLEDNEYVNKLYKVIKLDTQKRNTIKAIHYSDAHVDLDYAPGTNANCNVPLCCRKENGIPADPKDKAGYWGEYSCDTTRPVISKMFDFIKDEIKPDVLFWTGDMSAHSVWENSNKEVIDVNYIISREMQEKFGDQFMVYPL